MGRRIRQVSERYPWLVAEHPAHEAERGAHDAERGAHDVERLDPVAGFAYGSTHRSRAAYRWAADVTVYIGEGQRGQGVGSALYRALLQLLRRQGVTTACAGITLPNPASVGLHESLGFELVGIYRRIGWKAGTWHDVGWWQLQLADDDEPPQELGPPVRLDSL